MADSRSLSGEHGRRTRRLTPGGQELYENSVFKYKEGLRRIQMDIDILIAQVESTKEPSSLKDNLWDSCRKYEMSAWDFSNFLVRQKTEDSELESISQGLILQSVKGKVDEAVRTLERKLHKTNKSVYSSRARSTSKSSLSSASTASYFKRKLDLDKAKLRQRYIEQECTLERQKTELELNMRRLESQRNVDEAECELSAIMKEFMEDNQSVTSDVLSKQRVDDYVTEQFNIKQEANVESIINQPGDPMDNTFVTLNSARHETTLLLPPQYQHSNTREPDTKPRTLEFDSAGTTLPSNTPWSTIEPIYSTSIDWQSKHQLIDPPFGLTRTSDVAPPSVSWSTMRHPPATFTTCKTPDTYLPGMPPAVSPRVISRPLTSGNTHHSTGVTIPSRVSEEATNVEVSEEATNVEVSPELTSVHTSREETNVEASKEATNEKMPGVQICHDMSTFLIKKDLLKSRLTKFEDKPEYFESWRRTFKSVVTGLQLSPLEELELLQIWLGPESSSYARSIRASHSDPAIACNRLWERLMDRYGRPEVVEAALKQKLAMFPKISNKDVKQLYELADIVAEIASVKSNPRLATQLAYFDSSGGVNLIVQKLPYGLQEGWTKHANKYKNINDSCFPPFTVFVKFLFDIARMKNDPSFVYDTPQEAKPGHSKGKTGQQVTSRKTETVAPCRVNQQETNKKEIQQVCPLHQTAHSLNMCRAFRQKGISERKQFLRDNGICYRCCGQKKHLAKDCKKTISCALCKSQSHPTALHVAEPTRQTDNTSPTIDDHAVSTTCTAVCGDPAKASKSCAKTVLVVVHPIGDPDNALRLYAVIDEQSNRTLAKSQLFDYFEVSGPEIPYSLSSCSGEYQQSGRRASGLVIKPLDNSCSLQLPTVIECDEIPDTRDEIPSPAVARAYRHMQDIADEIHPLDSSADILLLIGRDLLPAHHVLDQRLGDCPSTPYAQKLRLGWVVVGETCLGVVHRPEKISVLKTFTLTDGRSSHMVPCVNNFNTKEPDVFIRTMLDNFTGPSVEDRKFVDLIKKGITRDDEGCWCMPLPFREIRKRLPGNFVQARKRAIVLAHSLRRNDVKRDHVKEFMEKLFINGHAELAPALTEGEEHWYLPLFSVYHPKKPDKVRCVFDSSAKCQGVSLNDALLPGPDLLNSLLGIIIRFRQHSVAVSADIEQMFYRFSVPVEHRNYLRFLWHRDNDIDQDLQEYRMTRHVFGNSPSPSIATFGLRETVASADTDVKRFVEDNFYVDDGLTSVDTPEEAIGLLWRTQDVLRKEGNIRLHKITSNNLNVLNAFPKDDLAKDLVSYDLELSETPPQRSLGISWDIASDSFTFRVSKAVQPYTKRGVLSTINSLYDPIGFLSPVVIKGKLIMRDIMCTGLDWDDPLPPGTYSQWCEWRASLSLLEDLSIPRAYAYVTTCNVVRRELHIFSDASQKAIGAVVYMKIVDDQGKQHLSFVLGKAKVAPSHGHTIPRLELCAALLATQLKDTVTRQLDYDMDNITMYTDSRVILGYIQNERRRFYIYVGNRVDQIRHSTKPEDWRYVSTEVNPADIATRSLDAESIQNSVWLLGPSFLLDAEDSHHFPEDCDKYPLVEPDSDKEVRPYLSTMMTSCTDSRTSLGSHRFEKFSKWSSLVKAIATLQHVAASFSEAKYHGGWHRCIQSSDGTSCRNAEYFILKEIQKDHFSGEIHCIREGRSIPRNSSIIGLSPFMDSNGVLRVGGRLAKGKDHLHHTDLHPIIIPKNCHIAILLVRHHHEAVQHQGRRITEGRLRSSGFWIIGMKRLVGSVIHRCVTCRKLRGSFCAPRMADLPVDRLSPGPPFSFVGVDTFGPWSVTARKTRGGLANQKRWAILFTCLASRAIHIEVVEELSSSSFINALRRFVSIRGPIVQLRSDRGTNFVGAAKELGLKTVFVEGKETQDFLQENRCTWIFNPPHASHFGGVWERMIGVSRKILDAMLLRSDRKNLTHETLCTFLAEVCAIVNSRPLVPLTEDPDDPSVLSPSMLLTQKSVNQPESLPSLDIKDMYKAQWRHVQILSNEFWKKWQREYLCALQARCKWTSERPNLKEGDIVLLREYDCHRTEWPLAAVSKTFPASDGCVREVEVRTYQGGKFSHFVRPVHELVPLLL
ncbi:uncharacterized protein LOC117317344 [Pecten maximus]|uniref:uncharacterized protein LOC117317344 n=1 Tax=Pecten maximus TaxID=6579 RepID=UPI0014583196|nr:uncharacterized protein LOC117317344 [Pecten maximus]